MNRRQYLQQLGMIWRTLVEISTYDETVYDGSTTELKRMYPEYAEYDCEEIYSDIQKMMRKHYGHLYQGFKPKWHTLGLFPHELEEWFTVAKVYNIDTIIKLLDAGYIVEQVTFIRETVQEEWAKQFMFEAMQRK